MNGMEIDKQTFNAHFIESSEINSDVASNCKLRSKFVHEKIFKSRIKDAAYSVLLLISEKGIKVINPLDQVVLSAHSMKRISYSASDRPHRLFALVVRSSAIANGQICYIFRMDTSEEADLINRYFGSIFKQLHNQKKDKKFQKALIDFETPQPNPINYENSSELFSCLEMTSSESFPERAFDSRLRQISTSNINELVSEMHNIRRLSLSTPCTEPEDHVELSSIQLQSLNSSLDNASNAITNNFVRPVLRRKKPDSKGNRFSAAIERWSFRGSKDISMDHLKSGSPVVALKEQLEYEDLLSTESSLASDAPSNSCGGSHSHSKKNFISINKDSKPGDILMSKIIRKNSAPICNPLDDEQPPIPPVRIHSLRNTTGPRPDSMANASLLTRSCGEGASQSIEGGNNDPNEDDYDLSSITTPSSCGQVEPECTRFSVYNDPPPLAKINRELITHHSNVKPSPVPCPKAQVNSANCNQSPYPSVPIEYFRHYNKEQAMLHLVNKDIGCFLLRFSGSQPGCLALSVKVADKVVSHYIVTQTGTGVQMKGLDKIWPNLQSLVTHLSVMPEILPCPIKIVSQSLSLADRRPSAPATYFTGDHCPPQSQSATDEYRHRMEHFLTDVTMAGPTTDQYQQLSDFSSLIASLDLV